jgi:hypothetical protein
MRGQSMETKRLIEYACSLLEEDHPMTLRQLHYAIFGRNPARAPGVGIGRRRWRAARVHHTFQLDGRRNSRGPDGQRLKEQG